MPYDKDSPPERIKGLPEHAQHIWIAAYNSAHKQYGGDESRANAIAWAAVKEKYKQEGDQWVEKGEVSKMDDSANSPPADIRWIGEIQKVDAEQRIVYGRAMQEIRDRQDDLIPHDIAKQAFEDYAKVSGAVREMHQPRAVGRLESWSPVDDQKAIDVAVYLSKSRDGEDALQKVKEGILKGFSIGGKAEDWKMSYSSGKPCRVLNKIAIRELSLVDVPANPSAMITLWKADDAPRFQYAGEGDSGDIRAVIGVDGTVTITKQMPRTTPADRQTEFGTIQQLPNRITPLTIQEPAPGTTAVPISQAEAITAAGGTQDMSRQAEVPAPKTSDAVGVAKADFKCPHCGAPIQVEKAGEMTCAKCGKGFTAQKDGEQYTLTKAEDPEETEKRLKDVGSRVGIRRRDGSPKTPPKDYPTDMGDYADPANYAFPCDESRAATAVGYFNAGGEKLKAYAPNEKAILGRRIARLSSRYGTKYAYRPAQKQIERADKPQEEKMDKNLQQTLSSARELAEKARAETNPDALKAMLDQIASTMDVAVDQASDSAPITAGVAPTTVEAAAPATAPTPTAPSSPSSSPPSTPTPSVPETKVTKGMDTQPLASAPPAQAVAPMQSKMSALMEEKIGQFTFALEEMGSLRKAMEVSEGDGQLFDRLFSKAAMRIMDEGNFNEDEAMQGILSSHSPHLRRVSKADRVVGISTGPIDWYRHDAEFAKGIQSTTAPGYYLQRLVRLMIPVVQPLRRRLPQTFPQLGATSAHWKAQFGYGSTSFGTAMYNTPESGVTLASTTGAGQTLVENVLDFAAPYQRQAWNDIVTLEAIAAERGFDDPFRIALFYVLATQLKTMELFTLMSNNVALGALGAVTLAGTGSGNGLGLTSNDKFAVTGLVGYGYQLNQEGNGGKGGATKVNGETAATVSAVVAATNYDSIVVSWPALAGAVAYNLYYVPGGITLSARYVGTYTVNKVTLTSLPNSTLALQYPTTDGTANANGYEGVINWCELGTVYGNTIPNTSSKVIDQAGAALTLSGPNSIKEIDTLLSYLATTWQISPTSIWGSPNSMLHITNIIGSGTNPPYRFNLNMGPAQAQIVGGAFATGYTNKFLTLETGAQPIIDLMPHPYLPDGTILILCETVRYQMANEARAFGVDVQIPITYMPFANLNFSWPFGVVAKDTLTCYHPPAMCAIQGVKVP